MKHFRPIKKDPPVDKDPPEEKELPDPSGPLSKVIPSSSIASCNAEVTKVMKQAKQPVTKSGYTKLTPGRRGAERLTAAIQYYKKFPDLSLTEPTVRRLKNLYLKELTTDRTLKGKFHQNTQRMHACFVYKNAQRKSA